MLIFGMSLLNTGSAKKRNFRNKLYTFKSLPVLLDLFLTTPALATSSFSSNVGNGYQSLNSFLPCKTLQRMNGVPNCQAEIRGAKNTQKLFAKSKQDMVEFTNS